MNRASRVRVVPVEEVTDSSQLWSLPVLFAGGLLLLLLPRVVLFVQMGTSLIGWRWQFDYDEGINLNATFQLAHGHNIYHHNGPGGFLSAPYPPLFYLLNAVAIRLTGPSFGVGRTVSFLSTATIAVLLIYIVVFSTVCLPITSAIRQAIPTGIARMHTIAPPAGVSIGALAGGLLAGMLWLSLSPVIVWAAFYKQDMLALALSVAGIAWALRHQGSRAIYFAAVLFACAFYTKQSAFSAAVATLLWLLLQDRRRGVSACSRMLRFLGLLTLLIPVPLAAANVLTQGGVWEHVVGNQMMPWRSDRFQWVLDRLRSEYWPLLLCGAVCLLLLPGGWRLRQKGRMSDRGSKRLRADSGYRPEPQVEARAVWNGQPGAASLIALYALVGVSSSLVQIGYEGANFNHLLDGLLPLCLLVGYVVARLGMSLIETQQQAVTLPGQRAGVRGRARYVSGAGRSAFSSTLPVSGIMLLVCGTLLWAQVAAYKDPRSWFYNEWPNQQSDVQMRRLSELVASTKGDIYSEDIYLLLTNGRRVLYDDPSTLVPLANAGRWDDSALVKALNERQFTLILFWNRSPRWTQRQLTSFLLNYKLQYRGKIEAYVPIAAGVTPGNGAPTTGRSNAKDGHSTRVPPTRTHNMRSHNFW